MQTTGTAGGYDYAPPQRKRFPFQGSWRAAPERFSQICDCLLPPAAPSFPSCRKRRGRKGALGRVWCILRMLYRKEYDLQILRTHVPPYERYGTRRLLRSNWTCELVPLNGCGKSALRSKAAGQYGFAETPTMLIRGILNNYGLFQISRERSKKTEAVFLVALKGVPGGNRNLPGLVFFWRGKRK